MIYQEHLIDVLSPDRSPRDLVVVLEKLLEAGAFSDFLYSLAENDVALRDMATKSYRHPNGYDKLVLISPNEFPVPYELRLHHWLEEGSGSESDIHNHGWDFASHIVFGSLNCEEFERAESGTSYRKIEYLRQNQGSFSFSEGASCDLDMTKSFILKSGETYFQPRGVLHRVSSSTKVGTCTMVLQGATESTVADNYIRPSGAAPQPKSLQKMSMQEYRLKLLELVEKIGRVGDSKLIS
ncbi:MAG: hypothetical protein EX272_11900 [Chromatiales bacterium]|nr:MAG: hypothetical protein EX272_11900 [Chromatiales bacterium]